MTRSKRSGMTSVGPARTRFTADLGFMQLAPSEVLAAVARGELDLNPIARRELANRGLNRYCKWVGFEEAERLAELTPRPGPNGKMIYMAVPEDCEESVVKTAWVIRNTDFLYVRGFDARRRVVTLCHDIERAKRFETEHGARDFREQHSGCGLSLLAVIVPTPGNS